MLFILLTKGEGGVKAKKTIIAVDFTLEIFKTFRMKTRGGLESLMND